MKIAGFQELSLQDYPGKMSVIIFTQGCNLNCWWCFNPEMIPKRSLKKKISEKTIMDYILKKNQYQIWIDAITICGGEPTIQKDLDKFLYKLRTKIPYLKIKLDTNGTNPEILENLIKRDLIDYIAMDVKINLLDNEEHLNGIKIVKQFIDDKDGEFRWTLYPGTIEFERKTKKISEIFGGSKIYFQKFIRSTKLNNDNHEKEYKIKELAEFEKESKENFKNMVTRW